jgi:hypothetical protein
MAETLQIVIEGVDKLSGPMAGARKAVDGLNQSASAASKLGLGDLEKKLDGLSDQAASLGTEARRLGSSFDTVTNAGTRKISMLDKMGARLVSQMGQMSGLGRITSVMGAESMAAMGSTVVLGAAIAGVGAFAAKTAWDLGAMALKEDAIKYGGKDAKTSVDGLAEAFHGLALAIGRVTAPAVNQIALHGIAIAATLSGDRVKALNAEILILEARLREIDKDPLFKLLGGAKLTEDAIRAAKEEVQRLNDASLQKLVGELDDAQLHAWSFQAAMAGIAITPPPENLRMAGAGGMGFGYEEASNSDPTSVGYRNNEVKIAEAIAKANAAAAKATQSAWESAFEGIKASAQGFLDKASEASKALTPGGADKADPNAPGNNGWAENMFRMKDIAVNGPNSKWMAEMQVSQEEAAGISAEFEAKNFTERVKKWLNTTQLVDMVMMAEQAKASQEAFVNEIAKAAGANPVTAAKLMGLGTAASGKGATGAAQTDAVTAGLTTMWKGAADKTAEAWKAIGEAVTQGVNVAIGAINSLIKAWNDMEFEMAGFDTTLPDGTALKWAGIKVQTTDIPLIAMVAAAAAAASASGPPKLAMGGTIRRGGSAIVGERGPEMLSLPRGAQVTPLGGGYGGLAAALAAQPIIIEIDGERIATVVRSKLQLRGAGALGW